MINEKKSWMTAFFAFHFRKIVVLCHRVKNRKFLWYNSEDAFCFSGSGILSK